MEDDGTTVRVNISNEEENEFGTSEEDSDDDQSESSVIPENLQQRSSRAGSVNINAMPVMEKSRHKGDDQLGKSSTSLSREQFQILLKENEDLLEDVIE